MGKTRLLGRAFLSLLLGIAVVGVISLCETKLPYSPLRDEITDAASMPAFFLTRLLYPEGVHTGGGRPNWGFIFLLAGIFSTAWPGLQSFRGWHADADRAWWPSVPLSRDGAWPAPRGENDEDFPRRRVRLSGYERKPHS
jgi:hypothetical protein